MSWPTIALLVQVTLGPLEYNRDVRPILSDKCVRCHGPDAQSRQAELRLDQRESTIAARDGRGAAVVPGKPDASELIARITSPDAERRMPPPEAGPPLTPQEIAALRQWIADGAEYQPHWSLVAPRRSPPPTTRRRDWSLGPLDPFVLEQLERRELAPSPPADAATLLRRASLDLIGLPPSLDELDEASRSIGEKPHENEPDWYERAIDRLLASPRYGERMAVDWLDAARYADTNGMFSDTERRAWPWRDWVLRAFNRNQPFDEFTIEQLAGDLLPSPTLEQRIATGFNRQHTVTNETGIIDEEYRVEYMADRLETTATVWLGLTLGCARCHDHKYDPLTQRDYYRLFAYFNQGAETGLVSPNEPPPLLDVETPEQRAELGRLEAAKKAADAALVEKLKSLAPAIAQWEATQAKLLAPPRDKLVAHLSFDEGDVSSATPRATAPVNASRDSSDNAPGNVSAPPAFVEMGKAVRESGVVGLSATFDAMQHFELASVPALAADRPWSIGVWLRPTGSLNGVLSKIEPTARRRGLEIVWQKGRLQLHLVERWGVDAIEVATRHPVKGGDWHHFVVTYDGSKKASGVRVHVDGEPVELIVGRDSLTGSIECDEPLRVGRRDTGLGYYGRQDELRVYATSLAAAEIRQWYWSERLAALLKQTPERRDAAAQALLHDYFIAEHGDAELRQLQATQRLARAAEADLRAALPRTMVMQDQPNKRRTFILKRGQYDQPGDEVAAGTPSSLPPLRADTPPTGATPASATPTDAPPNRLALARWLVAPENPLTARVTVNRLWQQCFGEGLVRTPNDFGAQGEPPDHPALLDALAVSLQADGWDLKRTLRRIVTSATYRQSSAASADLVARDPENRWLARGPRYRLSAEAIRDQALAACGLLVNRTGGPSVKPYQPPGLWEAVSYDGELSYEPDRGAGLWRRSLYTSWKRQSPPPGLLAFDGPTRETCVVRRPRTNTPLQALVLLNDVTYIAAARELAEQLLAMEAELPMRDAVLVESKSAAESKSADRRRFAIAFRRITSRQPADSELDVLATLLEKQRARFAARPELARQLIELPATSPSAPAEHDRNVEQRAAWTVVVHAILNLDESITRR